jgi:heptosyltransferase-2
MVMAQSLFMTLRARWPDCDIDVLAPAWSRPVLARMPEVRETVEMPLGHGALAWGTRRRLGKSLASKAYSHAIVIPRSFKSALVPFHAGIPVRTGYRGEFRYGLVNDIRPLDKGVLTQTVQRFVSLGLPPDAPLPPQVANPALRVDADNQARLLREIGAEAGRPAVAMMPGAEYGPAKCWPLESFRDSAIELEKLGFQVWIMGSGKDRPAGEAIRQGLAPSVQNLCGKTRLEDAIDLLAATRAAITNDSGLMHVAAAVGTQVHALYGSSTPDFTPPLTSNRVVHYLRLECSPCFERDCPLGHLDCLRKIAADQVLANFRDLV